jgi:two-component system sensor histidine kinase YesM
LLEQLSINLEYSITDIEDFVFSQYFNSKINQYINVNQTGTVAAYNKKSSLNNFAFNLLNMKDYIKLVEIRDKYGEIFFYKKDDVDMKSSEYGQVVNVEKVKAGWGKTIWNRYSEKLILVSRSMFHNANTNYTGIISVGIDPKYFETLYKGISSQKGSSIVLLDENNDILITESTEDIAVVNLLREKQLMRFNENNKLIYDNDEYICNLFSASNSGIKILHIINMKVILKGSSRVTRIIIITLILSILFAVIVTGFISNNMSQNIRLLLKNIEVMSKGDFTKTIEPVSYDEIGMLACEFNSMGKKINQLINTVYNEKVKNKNAQIKVLQFEYDSLQSKMNPHFLYNTLETINSLAKLKEEDEISEMICLLGKLLRSSINNKKNIIRLQEEIDYIVGYLKIQSISYGDMIEVEYNFDECLMDALVPKLILQPIVENAIVHGFEKKIGKGKISITSTCTENMIVLTVKDDGNGISTEIQSLLFDKYDKHTYDNNKSHTKVGINSVDKRIKILYGKEYGVTIYSEANKGTEAVITFPLKFDGEEEIKSEL